MVTGTRLESGRARYILQPSVKFSADATLVLMELVYNRGHYKTRRQSGHKCSLLRIKAARTPSRPNLILALFILSQSVGHSTQQMCFMRVSFPYSFDTVDEAPQDPQREELAFGHQI